MDHGPFTAGTDGASGSRSMMLRRKARGQLVNEATLEGERERGGANGTEEESIARLSPPLDLVEQGSSSRRAALGDRE